MKSKYNTEAERHEGNNAHLVTLSQIVKDVKAQEASEDEMLYHAELHRANSFITSISPPLLLGSGWDLNLLISELSNLGEIATATAAYLKQHSYETENKSAGETGKSEGAQSQSSRKIRRTFSERLASGEPGYHGKPVLGAEPTGERSGATKYRAI